jgi:hypothetical protein
MNMTVQRLRQMKPGDQAIYYRGNLPADIERSKDVPHYREILEEVSATAKELEKMGLLALSERPAVVEFEAVPRDGKKITHRIPIVEYLAVGR